MDSLQDLLNRVDRTEPDEVEAIKRFIEKEFQAPANITVQPSSIIIGVKSAALAGSLRMHLPALQQAAQTDKKLIIRIG